MNSKYIVYMFQIFEIVKILGSPVQGAFCLSTCVTEIVQRLPSTTRVHTLACKLSPFDVVLRDAGNNEQGRCVHENEIEDGNQMVGDLRARVEKSFERFRILVREAACDLGKGVDRKTEILGSEDVFRYRTIFMEFPCMRGTSTADFVEAFESTNDESTLDAAVA